MLLYKSVKNFFAFWAVVARADYLVVAAVTKTYGGYAAMFAPYYNHRLKFILTHSLFLSIIITPHIASSIIANHINLLNISIVFYFLEQII